MTEKILEEEMGGPEGLEPPTLCFEGRCSIQLSYGPVEKFITTRDSCVVAAQAILPVPGGRPIKIIDLARRNFVPLDRPECSALFADVAPGWRAGRVFVRTGRGSGKIVLMQTVFQSCT